MFHIPLTILFGVILFKSMSWETVLDAPMFMYTGFLMDELGMAPMRDFFTYNMVGTHVIYRWLYHFFGAEVLGMRIADTAILAVILLLLSQVLRPFGFRVAWAGMVLFGLLHVMLGSHCYLQRDFFALVPIQLSILSATAWFGNKPWLRWFMTGLFVASIATIKPHLMLGGLVLYGFMIMDTDSTLLGARAWAKRAVRVGLWCILGGSIPILWMAAYLGYYGQLAAFTQVLIEYFPLHADISGAHKVLGPGETIPYVLDRVLDHTAWDENFQLALGVGVALALFLAAPTVPSGLRRYGGLLAVLALAYFLYPCIAKRFYDHHYYSFRMMTAIWISILLYRWSADTPLRIRLCSWGVALYVAGSLFYLNVDTLQNPALQATGYFRAARMEQWLGSRLEPGDTVQGIEWAFCGSSHAMLLTKAKPATHTIWGEVLFHHVSHPFVKKLRKDFLEQLTASEPRFIIRSKNPMDYVEGVDCTQSFPGFDAYVAENYFPALESKDFRIWELNSSPTAAKDRERYKRINAAPTGDFLDLLETVD